MDLFLFDEVLWQGERANGYHPAPEARGYCPLHIRDLLKDGREGKYIALKIGVTGGEKPSRELEVLQKISASPSEHPGSRNLVRLHDSFVIERHYGSHECLVLDLLGGNPQFTEGRRLPANVAKRMAKEVLLGLDCLHSQGITHGDLHAGNLSCVMPPLDHLDEHEFCEKFGEITTYNMERKDGKPIGPGVPRYLVLPGAFPKFFPQVSNDINVKIVDFGESFSKGKAPETVDTTQCLKPPEVMFGDPLDHRLDMWSMGCLLFELVVSHRPFFAECWGLMTPKTMQKMCSIILYLKRFQSDGGDNWVDWSAPPSPLGNRT
ncbi:kinase-like domain-containing protein [Phyllosticta capitalensis]